MTQIGEAVFTAPPISEEREPKSEKNEEKQSVKIRCLLFFDGTLNNRVNVEHRLSESEVYEDYSGEQSYENEKTNIALLEALIDDAADGFEEVVSIYTEGPGTMDEESDKLIGYAIGKGRSGVKAKVEQGIAKALTKIEKQAKSGKYEIGRLTVDVFGFSRGAAGARYCIHEVLDTGSEPMRQRLEALEYEVKKIEVCFAGLFDTVSSHGLSFRNDTRTLRLDAVSQARTVIQLAAADEYRGKFSLTTIQSAGNKGREIFLPGAHSDIGGGYREGPEERFLFRGSVEDAKEEARQLIAAGWYRPDEIKVRALRYPDGYRRGEVHAKREHLTNTYSLIPLRLMGEFMMENKIELLEDFYDFTDVSGIDDDLDGFLGVAYSYVEKEGKSKPSHWNSNNELLKRVRNRHLHFSSRNAFPNKARFSGGKRCRRTYDG